MKKNFFTALKLIIFLAIGFFFIWIFVKDLDTEQKKQIFHSFSIANYWWLFLCLFVGLLSHVFRTLRWNMLIHTIGYRPKFRNTFLSLMIGYFANLAIPRLGEVSRCTVLVKYEKIPFEKSFGTVIGERALDFLTFVLLFFFNLIIQYDTISGYVHEKIYQPLEEKFQFIGKGYLLYGLLIFAVFFIIFVAVFHKRLIKYKLYQKLVLILKGFWEGLKSLGKVKNPLLFIVYTILIWAMYYFMSYVCFFSLVETSSAGFDAVLSVLVMGTIGIMVVQGGIGIYPVIVAETLKKYNINPITGFALGWLIWGAQTFIIILSGIVSLILLPILNNKSDDKVENRIE
ncbi:MAG: lysylphosphatidylglycerol synthase transmembrane domain-containing protein [Bacteroidota bacterium]